MNQDNIRVLVVEKKRNINILKYFLICKEPHLKKPVTSPVKCGKDGRVNVAPINALKLFFFSVNFLNKNKKISQQIR